MVFTRQKAISSANPETPARNSQEQIFVKEAIKDGKSPHGNIMIYSFNIFFNTIRKRKVVNYIIMFLV